MFDRIGWYRTIGFQHLRFKRDFERDSLPDCPGAFVGTCDSSIAEWLSGMLAERAEHPRFVYWLTLNSHLPVLAPSPDQLSACATVPSLRGNSPLCSWQALVSNVHSSLAHLAARVGRPTVLVIVGDHAPPFLDQRTRAQFSSTEVPYIVLIPTESMPPDIRSSTAKNRHPVYIKAGISQ